jgi:hypothetical protein
MSVHIPRTKILLQIKQLPRSVLSLLQLKEEFNSLGNVSIQHMRNYIYYFIGPVFPSYFEGHLVKTSVAWK